MTTYHDASTIQGGNPQESSPNTTRQDTIQEVGREMAQKIQEAGKDVAEKAQEIGAQGQDVMSEYYQQGRAQALAWQKHIEQHIREKPLQSLAIAGGIGLVLGLLWRR